VEKVKDTGLCAVAAAPLMVRDSRLGVVTAYSARPAGFDERHVEVLGLLADATGAVLHEMDGRRALVAERDQLEQALESRAVIDQAKGVLMALHAEDADDAFERLVRASSRRNVKLRELATEIIGRATEGTLGPDPTG
jgi:GAF domain-containing protein